jgi:hypothetical protein
MISPESNDDGGGCQPAITRNPLEKLSLTPAPGANTLVPSWHGRKAIADGSS